VIGDIVSNNLNHPRELKTGQNPSSTSPAILSQSTCHPMSSSSTPIHHAPSSDTSASKRLKRTQSGTVVTSQPSLPTLPEVNFQYMDADVTGGEGYNLITRFICPIGRPNGLFLTSAVINTFGEALLAAAEKGVDYRDVVVALFYLGDVADTWELTKVVQKAFEGTSTPNVTNLDAGGLKVALWMWKESSKKTFLYKSTSGAMRSIKE
jgi:hypothetical protein